MWQVEAELYHWRMAEQWVNVLGMCADMEEFHLLLEEQGDGPSSGTLHCDLRRCSHTTKLTHTRTRSKCS